jgi:hypothetical protein
MTAPLAARVRKARAWSPCAAAWCWRPVQPGQPIGYVPGTGWCHVSCIVAANRQARPALDDGQIHD